MKKIFYLILPIIFLSGEVLAGGLPKARLEPEDIGGNAATVTNGVYTTGDQTIGGTKTFSSTIVGSVNGSAANVPASGVQAGALPSTVIVSSFQASGTNSTATYLRGDISWASPIVTCADWPAANVVSYLSTTFSTTTLSLPLAANTTYQFTFFAVMASSAATSGIFPTLACSVAPKGIFFNGYIPLTASTFWSYTSVVQYGGVAATDAIASMSNVVEIDGLIVTLGATNLTFMFRNEVAGGKVSYQNGTAIATIVP